MSLIFASINERKRQMSFKIIRNDIAKVKADAIVNSANPQPVIGGGTDSAIYEAAGKEQLFAERKKIGTIKCGEAAVTPAFKLKAKYIIHTVGPIWEGGDKGELEVLKSCYENSLKLAVQMECKCRHRKDFRACKTFPS